MAIANIFPNSAGRGEGFNDTQKNNVHCRLPVLAMNISGVTLLATSAVTTDTTNYSDEFNMRNSASTERIYIPETGYYLVVLQLGVHNGIGSDANYEVNLYQNTTSISLTKYTLNNNRNTLFTCIGIFYLTEKSYFYGDINDYGGTYVGNDIIANSTLSVTKLMVGSL